MRTACALVATCLLLGATACGEGQTEEVKVASAYNAVVAAIAEKDYDEACEGLTSTTRQDLRKAAMIEQTDGCGATLERVIAGVGIRERALSSADSSDVRITRETSATVNDVRISKQGNEWLVEGDLDFVRPPLSGSSDPQ